MKKTCRISLIAMLVLLCSPLVCFAQQAQNSPDQDFSAPEKYQFQIAQKATEVSQLLEEKPGPSTKPALRVRFRSPVENSGVNLIWTFPARVLDDQVFNLWIAPQDERIGYVTVRFRHEDKQIARHTYFNVAPGGWTQLSFAVREKGKANYYEPEDGFVAKQPVSEIMLTLSGHAGVNNNVLISDFRSQAAGESTPVATATSADTRPGSRLSDFSNVTPAIKAGDSALWLDESSRLMGARVNGKYFEAHVTSRFPTFLLLNSKGERVAVASNDRRWKVSRQMRGADTVAVTYEANGLTTEVLYTATPERVRCETKVLSEGEWKLVQVGAERLLGATLQTPDYGIAAQGILIKPAADENVVYERVGNGDNSVPNFAAAKVGERIFFYKPLTYSNRVLVSAERTADSDFFWWGGDLYFRPPDVINPATKLVHSSLAWQIETAGDVNRDGEVGWVDCGLAYRDRYIKPNSNKPTFLRDSYRFYYQVQPDDTYEKLAAKMQRIDFASGVWWVKGMMKTGDTGGVPQPSELHPYHVEPYTPLGKLASYKAFINKAHDRIGPYYGHDYIDANNGSWPAELIKLDPEGKPHRYYGTLKWTLYYKDNVRGLASGKLKEHYEKVLQTCLLGKGDPIMLDTFTAYARSSYHPEFPATPQNETEAKHEIARWLKFDKGLMVAAEGIIEGTQDVVDYGAIAYPIYDLVPGKFWESDFPRKQVPLLTVIYNGSTYLGNTWYEFRQGEPPWAALLVYNGGLWDWGNVTPDHLYEKAARYYWNQSIFWSRVADARLVDIDQNGSTYTLRFENGNVLWADASTNQFWLQEKGVRYDGFTPFNNQGVMAITKQGDFDIVLPVKEMLEVLPSQPHRDKLDVRISKERDGRIRVRGNFSNLPWKLPHITDGQEKVELVDVAPVVMLRRK